MWRDLQHHSHRSIYLYFFENNCINLHDVLTWCLNHHRTSLEDLFGGFLFLETIKSWLHSDLFTTIFFISLASRAFSPDCTMCDEIWMMVSLELITEKLAYFNKEKRNYIVILWFFPRSNKCKINILCTAIIEKRSFFFCRFRLRKYVWSWLKVLLNKVRYWFFKIN